MIFIYIHFFIWLHAIIFSNELKLTTPYYKIKNAEIISEFKLIQGFSESIGVNFKIYDNNLPKFQKKICVPKRKIISYDNVLMFIDYSDNLFSHYYHILEHLIGTWNFLTFENSDLIDLIILAIEDKKSNKSWVGIHSITKTLIESLYPSAKIILLEDLPRKSIISSKNLYVSNRKMQYQVIGKEYQLMWASCLGLIDSEKLKAMRDKVFKNLNITSFVRRHANITYIKRSSGRALAADQETDLLNELRKIKNSFLNVVDFTYLSFDDQLKIIANTDVLIGAHGNGLSHLLFLPNKSCVIEFYAGGESCFFRTFAQFRSVKYYGNSNNEWNSEDYVSLKNLPPFQNNIEKIDIIGTIEKIEDFLNGAY